MFYVILLSHCVCLILSLKLFEYAVKKVDKSGLLANVLYTITGALGIAGMFSYALGYYMELTNVLTMYCSAMGLGAFYGWLVTKGKRKVAWAYRIVHCSLLLVAAFKFECCPLFIICSFASSIAYIPFVLGVDVRSAVGARFRLVSSGIRKLASTVTLYPKAAAA